MCEIGVAAGPRFPGRYVEGFPTGDFHKVGLQKPVDPVVGAQITPTYRAEIIPVTHIEG